MKFKIIEDLSVFDGNKKFVIVEIENKNSKKLLFIFFCRPPCSTIRRLNGFIENVFKKSIKENKLCFVVGDFSLNCLYYNKNLEILKFYDRISAPGYILLITRPTTVTSITVSLINNIFAVFIFDTTLKLKKGIIKSDASDHFPVFVSLRSLSKSLKENHKITTHKRVMYDTKRKVSKTDLRSVN